MADAEERIKAEAVASGTDPDAAVEAASLRGPQPSPRGVQVLAKASSLAEIYARVRMSKDAVKRDVIMAMICHGVAKDDRGEQKPREYLGPGEASLSRCHLIGSRTCH